MAKIEVICCNPCYNGYGVHQLVQAGQMKIRCNPCYNGYGVHLPLDNNRLFVVVILVIMDMAYTVKSIKSCISVIYGGNLF